MSYADENLEKLDNLVQRVTRAQKVYSKYTQKEVDEIFKAAALAANEQRISLAKAAVEETGMGVVEDKVIKNHFASEYIYNRYRNSKTCGIIADDETYGIKRIAEPIGVIAGVIPTTNPTSTTIFKALLALKTRNGIIFSPHPRSKRCTALAAKVILDAAIDAGAPNDIIGWIEEPTVEMSQYLMGHESTGLILATGGPGMVKAAYCSGKPAIGVGAGNTPAVIDETADIRMAVSSILMSKTFDNGVICASEQAVVVVDEVYEEVKNEFIAMESYVLSPEEKERLGSVILKDGNLNADIVGKSACTIASMADIDVGCATTKVLIAETEMIGQEEPFSYEKLSPVLALYRAKDFEDAVLKAEQLISFGGSGHTSVVYTSPFNQLRIELFQERMNTGRVLVNMPASHGAIGDIYNFRLEPSLTLGCGSWGGNSVSENIGVKHLLNIKSVAERRENMLWFRVPPKIYFKYGAVKFALKDLSDKKRAFIVTDRPLYELGYVKRITEVLEEMGMAYDLYFDVEPDPRISTINRAVKVMNGFKPDVIIALGGGSPIDAAKLMWLMYEHPEEKFKELSLRFMDIRKRIHTFPKLGKKASFVAIPTTSGTGSEVTPFAVITEDDTGVKYPIADYELLPNMAIIDHEFVLSMPKSLTAISGFDAVTHALETYVSVFATEFTSGMALEALELLFKYLPSSYKSGGGDVEAREKVHYAATIAGMAFANSFLGVCHSMAHKLGSAFHVPHGLANALIIAQTVKYNAKAAPVKQTSFPQYRFPVAKERYAKIADHLGLGGETLDDKVERLVEALQDLKRQLDIPLSLKDAGVPEAEFYDKLEELSELAFDDQCTGGNPRYPLISEIKDLYIKAFYGDLDI